MDGQMIKLFKYGPKFGLPDAGPFCFKAEMLLKLSGLAFEKQAGNRQKAPKGKLPFIDDDGTIVADSTFIQMHLEEKYGIDFEGGLSDAEIHRLGARGIDAIAGILDKNKFLLGNKVCGADATIFSFVETMAAKTFQTPVIGMLESHANISAYRSRMKAQYFPELQG
jgi:glutathione S-transferase